MRKRKEIQSYALEIRKLLMSMGEGGNSKCGNGYQRHFPEHLCKLLFSCTSCTLLSWLGGVVLLERMVLTERELGSTSECCLKDPQRGTHSPQSQRPTAWKTFSPDWWSHEEPHPENVQKNMSKKRKKYQLINIVTSNKSDSQVSLSRMILDIFKFCCLYLLVLFAFSCGEIIFFSLTSNLFSIFILATLDSHSSLFLQKIANATRGSTQTDKAHWKIISLSKCGGFEKDAVIWWKQCHRGAWQCCK